MKHSPLRPYAAARAILVGASLIAVIPVSTAPSPPQVETRAIQLAADDNFVFTPDTSTFHATVAEGYPPLYNVLQGNETWNLTTAPAGDSAVLEGVDTHTTIGSFTNDDFLVTQGFSETILNGAPPIPIELGEEIDLANFGGGFENEIIEIPVISGAAVGSIADTVITPFGDFTFSL